MVGSVSGPAIGMDTIHAFLSIHKHMADNIRSMFRRNHCHIRQLAYNILAAGSHDRHGINPLPPLHPQYKRKESHQQKKPNINTINVQPPPDPPPASLPKRFLSR